MPFVISTITSAVEYVDYEPARKDGVLPRVIKAVTIKGGANLANKVLHTPEGVATEITEEQADFLTHNLLFIEHMAAGFVTIQGRESAVDRAVRDMTPGDNSRPLTEADYQPGGRQYKENPSTGTFAKAPKVVRAA